MEEETTTQLILAESRSIPSKGRCSNLLDRQTTSKQTPADGGVPTSLAMDGNKRGRDTKRTRFLPPPQRTDKPHGQTAANPSATSSTGDRDTTGDEAPGKRPKRAPRRPRNVRAAGHEDNPYTVEGEEAETTTSLDLAGGSTVRYWCLQEREVRKDLLGSLHDNMFEPAHFTKFQISLLF